jgi:NAD(P)-dependent dehydrogenase (short-subunit alcohol dehydrogenase family)
MRAVLEQRAAGGGESLEAARRRLAEQNAARDIAHIVAFLASPRSVAITGDSIAAGGGVGRAIHY